MIPPPGLYTGTLRHRRFTPRPHEFTYRLFMAWLDIDRIPDTMRRSRWTSHNRFNWASFDDRDHLGDSTRPLRARLASDAAAHGVTLPGGPIYLLTHLRYLGYCFNPISFYYCYGTDGGLELVLAEVNSTFGEQRTYWLTQANREPSTQARRHRCAKTMHVSPFMDMHVNYDFVLSDPGHSLVAHMTTTDRNGAAPTPFFDATLTLTHRDWSPRVVRGALLRHPWMTATVMVAIHWQALRLFLKRLPVFTHPARVRRPGPETSQ